MSELPGQQSQDDGDGSEHNKGGEASDKAAALVCVKIEAGIIERWTIQRHGDDRLEEPSGTTGVAPPPQSSRTIARQRMMVGKTKVMHYSRKNKGDILGMCRAVPLLSRMSGEVRVSYGRRSTDIRIIDGNKSGRGCIRVRLVPRFATVWRELVEARRKLIE